MCEEHINDILKNIEDADSGFIADIKKYWSIVTSFESVEEMITAPMKSVKTRFPKVPEEEWVDLLKVYNIPAMEGEFINQFMHFFTHEELKGLLKLYETHPLLSKSREKNKEMREDTYQLSARWLDKFNYLMGVKLQEWTELGYLE